MASVNSPQELKKWLLKIVYANQTISNDAVPILTNVIGDFIGTYQQKVKEVIKDTNKLIENPPVWNEKMPPQRYQTLALNFIKRLPFQYKLEYLNKLQQKCPFIITDVLRRPLNGPITYGLADLYRFMGLSSQPTVKMGKLQRKQPLYQPQVPPVFKYTGNKYGKNPFYHPVQYNYPIPDVNGNTLLMKLYQNNPMFLFGKLQGLYNKITSYQQYIKGGGEGTNRAHEKFYVKGSYKDMLELINHILKKETDPYYLTNHIYSTDVESNRAPMANYFRNNFDALLFQLISSQHVYKIDKKPIAKGMQISSKVLDSVKQSQKQYDTHPMVMISSHPSHLSKKKSHYKSRKRSYKKRRRRRHSYHK